jgi:hypothetical protein
MLRNGKNGFEGEEIVRYREQVISTKTLDLLFEKLMIA